MPSPAPLRFALQNDRLALSLSSFCPYLYVRQGDHWALVLVGGGGRSGGGELELHAVGCDTPRYRQVDVDHDALWLRGGSDACAVATRCSWRRGGDCLVVRTILTLERDLEVERLQASLWFVPEGKPLSQYGRPEHALAPELHPPSARHVAIRTAPAVIVEQGGIGVILIPDSKRSGGQGPMEVFLSLDLADTRRDAPRLSCGLKARVRSDGISSVAPVASAPLEAGTTLEFGYNVWLLTGARAGETMRLGMRRTWQLHGHSRTLHTRSQRFSWSGYAEKVYPSVLGGGTPGMEAFFGASRNALHFAYGLHWWGVRTGRRAWARAAELVRGRLLSAPLRSGCFPCAFDEPSRSWISTQSVDAVYATCDMAWTGYWMIRWHRDFKPDRELLRRASALGEFLVTSQLRSGAIPSVFRASDLRPPDPSQEHVATAAAVLLLAELARAARRAAFLRAARRGAEFLMSEVIPQLGDSEGPTVTPRTTMPWGAAPLPAEQVHWTAEALRVLYEVSREARLLDAGQQAMDHLCSYQQIGSSNTRAAFGAFVLDREAQRVGARFCETFLHYYCLTGLREYFERGVAALRASFENSGDPEALAAAAAIERRFGSLYVDGERGFVSAVDGCRVRVTKPVELRAEVVDVLGRARSIDIVVDGLPPRAKLRWNGRTLKFRRVAGSARACAALEAHGKGSFALRYQRPPKARLSARKKRW